LAIYEHVRSEYKWNGKYGYYRTHSGVKDLIKEKSGSVGDINQLLLNLLLQADIEAYPFLIKSRGNGLLNDAFPSMTELNYLLAYVQMGDKYLLLDGTAKYSPLGNLPLRATNINGLLLQGSQGKIVNLTSPNVHKTVTMVTYDVDTDMPSLFGEGKSVYKNYAGIRYRARMGDTTETDKDEEQEDEEDEDEDEEEEIVMENEYEILETKNLDNLYKDVSLSFKETIYNEVDKIGDQIFINAALDFGIDKNPFFQEKRQYPVFYRYKSDNRYIVKINLPEGYEVESLPEEVAMALPGKKANFKYSAKMVGETLVIDYNYKLNTDYFTSLEYEGLREIYRLIVEKTKEKIVLTKKT